MAQGPNGFVWYELVTSDIEAAAGFYRDVVGWEMEPTDMPGIQYTVAKAGEHRIAGIMPMPAEVKAAGGRNGWIGYVGVDDVDAAAKRLEAAGGRIHRAAQDIPGIGRFAVAADPQGASFVLFQPAGMTRAEPPNPMTPGHVGWHELYTTGWEAAFAFYAGQFGWSKGEAIDMGPMGTYQLFAAGGMPVGGMMDKPDTIPMPVWGFYFSVPEIHAAIARVKQAGGQVLHGPMEVPGGAWIIQGLDPQGAHFALVAPPQ